MMVFGKQSFTVPYKVAYVILFSVFYLCTGVYARNHNQQEITHGKYSKSFLRDRFYSLDKRLICLHCSF